MVAEAVKLVSVANTAALMELSGLIIYARLGAKKLSQAEELSPVMSGVAV